MTSIWLVFVFFVHGEPRILDGWFPLEVSSASVCEERAEHARAYLEEHSPVSHPSQVFCTHAPPKALSEDGPAV